MQNIIRRSPQASPTTFSHTFRDLLFYIDFILILAPFCHPFGSLWHTLGYLWPPFGSLSMSFGSLLVPLGSLLPTLALHFLTLGASLFHFSYLYAFSMKFSCIFYAHWNSDSCFLCLLSRPFQQSTRRQYQGPGPSHSTIFKAWNGTLPLAIWISQPDGSIFVHRVGGIA